MDKCSFIAAVLGYDPSVKDDLANKRIKTSPNVPNVTIAGQVLQPQEVLGSQSNLGVVTQDAKRFWSVMFWAFAFCYSHAVLVTSLHLYFA